MTSTIVTTLLWAAALSSGLMAGVYFAFSTFIMRAFSSLDPAHAASAMNAINTIILRSLFMPLFFGSSAISLCLAIAAIAKWGETDSGLVLLAGGTYFVGMFLCTVIFNVPLNNALLSLDSHSSDALQFWTHYVKTWTNWNHLRTISSLVACCLCVWLIANN